MPEDVAKHLAFPDFTTPIPGTLREVLDNNIAPRYKISLNGLVITKCKAGGLSMMLKTGLEVDQYYTVFNYGPPSPQKDLKSQEITVVSGPGMKPAPIFSLPGHRREKTEMETPPDTMIMDNLETSLATTVDKGRGNKSGAIV